MFAHSNTVLILLAAVGLGTLAVFLWALLNGQFDHPQEAALVLFDERDLALAREWETEAQRRERHERYGTPLVPGPDEWGGRWR